MRGNHHWLRRALVAALAGGIGGMLGQSAWADSITVKSGSGASLVYDNIHVSRIENDKAYFTNDSGTEDSKALASIVKFSVDSEPAFTAGEDAFANQDWKTAADNYGKAISVTNKQWIKDRASIRLMDAAGRSGDFQTAVKGFLAMADRDPDLAKAHRPDISIAKPADLDGAIPQVKTDLDSGTVKTDEQKVLLPFLVELYMKKGDSADALDTLNKLVQIDPNGAAKDPLVMRAQASISLGQADDDLKQSKFQAAVNLIESHQAAFTDPGQQADALYELAEAKEGLASKDRPDDLMDAAVAYMRVVALFKNADGKPHVADSLFKAGAIYEQLAKPSEAVLVYQQVPALFKDTDLTDKATADIQRLQTPKTPH